MDSQSTKKPENVRILVIKIFYSLQQYISFHIYDHLCIQYLEDILDLVDLAKCNMLPGCVIMIIVIWHHFCEQGIFFSSHKIGSKFTSLIYTGIPDAC